MINEIESFSKSELELYVNGCKKLLCGEVSNEKLGICYNLGCVVQCWYEKLSAWHFVCDLSYGWERRSVCGAWPIQEVRGYGKWEGPNLESRHSLLRYLIDKAERRLGEIR